MEKKHDRKLHVFEHMFSVFKQYYMYFYILFHPQVFQKKTKNCCLNTRTKRLVAGLANFHQFLSFSWLICFCL